MNNAKVLLGAATVGTALLLGIRGWTDLVEGVREDSGQGTTNPTLEDILDAFERLRSSISFSGGEESPVD